MHHEPPGRPALGSRFAILALTLAACGPAASRAGEPARVEVAPPVAPHASASAAPPPSPDPLAGFPKDVHDLRTFPDGTRMGIASAVYGDAVYAMAPEAHTAAPTGRIDRPTSVAWLDLDGDGAPELLGWDEGDPSVYGVYQGRMVPRPRLGALLQGARTSEAVRARIPVLTGYVAPAPGVAARDVLLSLRYASDAQIRALMAAKGVRICYVRTGNATSQGRKCHTLSPSKVGETQLNEELRALNAVQEFEGEPFDVQGYRTSNWAAMPPDCVVHADSTSCQANLGGPGYLDWELTGAGATLRLTGIDSVTFEDT
jgi:hypothetical protein